VEIFIIAKSTKIGTARKLPAIQYDHQHIISLLRQVMSMSGSSKGEQRALLERGSGSLNGTK
jgi:translation initiation factor 2 beta subunit (eIF-2beta)/eIF-5